MQSSSSSSSEDSVDEDQDEDGDGVENWDEDEGRDGDGDEPALSDDAQSARDAETDALRLWRDLEAALKPGGSVEEVLLTEKYCGACHEVYETVDADEFDDGEFCNNEEQAAHGREKEGNALEDEE